MDNNKIVITLCTLMAVLLSVMLIYDMLVYWKTEDMFNDLANLIRSTSRCD